MKKKMLAMALMACLLAVASIGTLAYFSTTGTAQNVITAGNIHAVLHEQTADGKPFPVDGIDGVMPGAAVDKIVFVENTGDHPAYVRVKLTALAKDKKGEQMPWEQSMIALDVNTAEWTYQDGWYYYNGVLAAGENTAPLLRRVLFSKDMDNAYMESSVQVDVTMQAVQSQNNGALATAASGWPAE